MLVEISDTRPRRSPTMRVVAACLLDVPCAPPCARDFMTTPAGVRLKAVIAAETIRRTRRGADGLSWRWASLTPAEKSAIGGALEAHDVGPGRWVWCRIPAR